MMSKDTESRPSWAVRTLNYPPGGPFPTHALPSLHQVIRLGHLVKQTAVVLHGPPPTADIYIPTKHDTNNKTSRA